VEQELVHLVERCLAGDEPALREFVDMFQHRVFALCFRMLGHRHDAEDTAQISLARAVKYLKNWDHTKPLAPWVLKIAANRCRTALSKRQKLPPSSVTIPEPATTDQQAQLGLGEELHKALDVLKTDQRTCFELFYLQELSIQEISDMLDLPHGTIKTWLHRSRKLLAQHLQSRGITPETRSVQDH